MNTNVSTGQKKLLDVLTQTGKINPENSQSLKSLSNQELEDKLQSENMVSGEDINRAYANILNLPFIFLKDKRIPNEILGIIPENLAREYKIVAYELTGDNLKIAVAKPSKLTQNLEQSLNNLKSKKNLNIQLAITSLPDLDKALEQYGQGMKSVAQTPTPTATIKTIDLTNVQIPLDVITKFPEDIARKYQMVVFESPHPSFIKVAVANPNDKKTKEILEFVREKNDIAIEEYQTTPGQIYLAMKYYHPSVIKPEPLTPPPFRPEAPEEEAGETQPKKFISRPTVIKPEVPSTLKPPAPVPQVQGGRNLTQSAIKPDENDLDKFLGQEIRETGDLQAIAETGNIPKILAAAIALAVRRKASDIHIEPEEKNLRLRFRIDGILHDIIKLPLEEEPAIISRIKILAQLKIDESRIPQDGRFDCSTGGHLIDLRISTLPTVHGEKAAMRVLDKSLKMYTMEELGIAGKGLKILTENIDKPFGVVLATGPTGSGKSTTLYAILNRISTASVNIITLEDPVEYEIPGINQCQIKPKIGFTFANGLRSVLRQDPNVIMVGEIRDAETASLATHAALTGHLVLSSLHTNDATGALPRLINMGVEPFLITSSINCIVAQRLVRKLCQKCKKPAHIPEPVAKEIEQELAKLHFPGPYQFFEGRGCSECDQGYKGRIGIFEVLPMTDQIEALAIAKRPASEIRNEAVKEGMVTMKQDGLIKAQKGITSVNEVLRVVTI